MNTHLIVPGSPDRSIEARTRGEYRAAGASSSEPSFTYEEIAAEPGGHVLLHELAATDRAEFDRLRGAAKLNEIEASACVRLGIPLEQGVAWKANAVRREPIRIRGLEELSAASSPASSSDVTIDGKTFEQLSNMEKAALFTHHRELYESMKAAGR